jgi:hypothetical protein
MQSPRLGLVPLALGLAFLCAACSDAPNYAPSRQNYTAGPSQQLSCVPNLDGVIDANELQPDIGVPLSYLVSPAGKERTVDVAGTVDANGDHQWDMSIDYATDQAAHIEAQTISGKWYASSFPDSAFVVPFDVADTTEQVLSEDDDALSLLGLASHDPNPSSGKTLIVYQTPVTLLTFPLKPGVAFTSTGTIVNGMLDGLPYAGKDVYSVSDDAIGELILPQVTFSQVHRVRTTVTNEPAVGANTSQEQVSFYFECFSEVARATSLPNETAANFTTASEVRRLGFNQ